MRRSAVLVCVVLGGSVVLSGCRFPWLWHHGKKPGGGRSDAGAPPDGGASDGGGAGDGGAAECAPDQFAYDGDCRRKAVQISAGSGHTCALLEGGDLKCWGDDTFRELGYGGPGTHRGDDPGEMGDALPVVPLASGEEIDHVSAGSGTCVSFTHGGAKCWGYNGYGLVLGIPVPEHVEDTVDTLAGHAFPDGKAGHQVLCESDVLYARLDDGSVVRSLTGGGFAVHGLGEDYEVKDFDRSPLYDGRHLCALVDEGHVVCDAHGGSAEYGEVGRDITGETGTDPLPHVALGAGLLATQVATGGHHSCALLVGGDVKCWGRNDEGQLGQDHDVHLGLSPSDMGDALVAVALGAPAVEIAAGVDHTCARLDDGQVKCWGRNDHGQLGVETTDSMGDDAGEMASLPSVDLGTGRTAVGISANQHTCAVLDDGSVKCWGPNHRGELGQGDTSHRGGAPGDMGDALPVVDLGG